MATTTPGIGLGDAVLTMTCDLSALRQGLDQVGPLVNSKLQPAGAAVTNLGKGFDQVGTSAAAAGAAAGAAANNIQILAQRLLAEGLSAKDTASALENLGYSEKEASAAAGVLATELENVDIPLKKIPFDAAVAGAGLESLGTRGSAGVIGLRQEIMTVDQALGVRLPRGVTGFLSTLPGVAAAMDAAFSASVVFFLISALVQASEKLADFISNTFIFTDQLRQADEIVKKNNIDLAKYGDETKKLKDAFQTLGQEGIAKTSTEMRMLTKDIETNNIALTAAKAKFAELNASLQPSGENIFLHSEEDRQKALDQAKQDHAAEIEQARSEVNTNLAIQKENAQKLANLAKQASEERQAAARTAALAEIEIEKERGNSIAALKRDENQALAADANNGIGVLTQIDAKYHLEVYNNEVTALQKKIALDHSDPSKDPGTLKKDLEKLEQVQRDHAATLIKIYADTIQGINNLSLGESTGGGGIVDHLLGSDFQDKFAQFEADTQALGIVTSGGLTTSVQNAAAAYTRLKDSGLATYDELLHALLKVQQAQLAFDRDLGNTAAAKQDQQAIDGLNGSINKLEGTEAKFSDSIRRQSPVLKAFQQELKQTQTELNKTGSVSMAVGAAIGTGISVAMQAYAQGAITIQQALRTMVQAEIQAVASIAEVRGTKDLAEAFGDLGDFNYPAAANHFAAAALWFSLAGAASFGSAALSGKGSSASTGFAAPGGTSPAVASPAQGPGQQPVSVVNTPHLYGGGLFTQRTLAMIGDAPGGGNQREAVLPLGSDSSALDEIAGRIHERMGATGGGNVINVHVDGVISADNLQKVFKKASQGVSKGTIRFTAGNSFRYTRRG